MALTADQVVVILEAKVNDYNRRVDGAERNFSRRMGLMSTSALTAERQTTRSFRSIQNSATAMSGTLTRVLTGAAILLTGKKVLDYEAAWRNTANTLRLYSDTMGDANQATSDLIRVATDANTSVEDLGMVTGAAARAARELGKSKEDVLIFAEAVSKGAQIANTGSSAVSGALLQLSQGISSPRVQLQEFNSIVEATPRLAQAFADGVLGMGSTVGELRTSIANGEVSGQQLFEGLISQIGRLREEFATIETGPEQAFNRLNNRLTETLGNSRFAKAGADAFSGAIDALANNADAVVDVLDVLADNVDVLTDALLAAGVAASVFGAKKLSTLLLSEIATIRASIASHQGRITALRGSRQAVVEETQATLAATQARVAELEVNKAYVQADLKAATARRAFAVSQVQVQEAIAASTGRTAGLTKAKASLAKATTEIIQLSTLEKGVTQNLTEARRAESTAVQAAMLAQTQHQRALQRTSLAARAAAASSTILRGAMAALGGPVGIILTAATAFLLLRTNAKSAEDVLDGVRLSLDKADRKVKELTSDTEELKKANDRLTEALRTQDDVNADLARNDIQRLNERIKKNKELRQLYADEARIQLADARKKLDSLEVPREFRKTVERYPYLSKEQGGTPTLDTVIMSSDEQEAVLDAIRAQMDAGEDISKQQQNLIKQARERRDLEQQIADLTDQVYTLTSDTGSTGSGNKGETLSEDVIDATDALAELRASLDAAKAAGETKAAKALEDQIGIAERTLELLKAGIDKKTASSVAKDEASGKTNKTETDTLRGIQSVKDAWNDAYLSKRQLAEQDYNDTLKEIAGLKISADEKAELEAKALDILSAKRNEINEEERSALNELMNARDSALGNEIAIINRRAEAAKKAARDEFESEAQQSEAIKAIEDKRLADIKAIKDEELDAERDAIAQALQAKAQATEDWLALEDIRFEEAVRRLKDELGETEAFEQAKTLLTEAHAKIRNDIQDRMRIDQIRKDEDAMYQRLQMAETFTEGFESQWDIMVSDAEKAAGDIGILFADTFGPGGSITQSIGHASGRAIAFGDDFEDSMEQAARSIGSRLIGELINLGLQMAITAALGQTLGQGAVASSGAQAVSLAIKWAPAAAAASLATLGANAAPAAAALVGTHALSAGLSTAAGAAGFKDGVVDLQGPGTSRSDSIRAKLSRGESVVTAPATALNAPYLEAMNAGLDMGKYLQGLTQPIVAPAIPHLKLPSIRMPQPREASSNRITIGAPQFNFSGPINQDTMPLLDARLSEFGNELVDMIDRKMAREDRYSTSRHERPKFAR